MNKNEKMLFKELCRLKDDSFNESLLKFESESVLGYLFYNRMQAVAYERLKSSNLLSRVNREFRNSLLNSYQINREKNKSYFKCVNYVAKILDDVNCDVAMLKGAMLCSQYPDGCRTSNDIDVLVRPEDVTKVGERLKENGFAQGNIREGKFVPATRKEIIESKINRGETVPYVKKVDLPYMQFLEVDINFSLDYKSNGGNEIDNILRRKITYTDTNITIPTLEKTDFFIHLCAHLYKEATTYPWIKMRRDMTLYKYCDIYILLSGMNGKDVKNLFERAKELGCEKICAYAILETVDLFDVVFDDAIKASKKVLDSDQKFVLEVISPREKKKYIYQTESASNRFFMKNRERNLREINYEDN